MIYPNAHCQKTYDGWLMYQAPYRGWIHQGPAKMSVDSYHAKAAERRGLVKSQLDSIAARCRPCVIAGGCTKEESK